MTHDEAIEAAARVLCELRIRDVRRWDKDPDELEKMMAASVDYAWEEFIPYVRAVAPLLMEYGAWLMQERAIAEFMAWYPGASIDRPGYAAAKGVRGSLEAIDPAAIVNPTA